MDIIQENGYVLRISERGLETIRPDGVVLMSIRPITQIPTFEDLKLGEYKFTTLPGSVVALHRSIEEVDNK